MVKESWKIIENFPNYEISNLGKIKRISRVLVRKNFPYTLPEKIMKFYNKYSGYSMVKLWNNKESKSFLVHRLVAKAFIDNPRNLEYVNHIDENKLNNNVFNLEWVTSRENSCHAKNINKSSSKFTGVSFHQFSGKWYASINYNNKSTSLGYYETELEAYQARKNFELTKGIINKYL